MDFFGRQDLARTRSRQLVALFALAVVGVVLTIYGIGVGVELWLAHSWHLRGVADPMTGAVPLWQPKLLAEIAAVVGVIIGVGMWREGERLSAGGGSVALALGGRQVLAKASDPDEILLRNVVEEVAIAAGHPMPYVFVLHNEPGINAFAAGWTPEDAAIAVTRGALELLSRDELQGVVAHEMSHLVQGDTRLNMRLLSWLAGLQALGNVGTVLWSLGTHRRPIGGSRGGQAWPLALVGALVWVAGSLGLLAGRLVRAAVSRQREHLADAAAVQYTRDRYGLANALKKIGGWSRGSQIAAPQAAALSHLFLGAPERLGRWRRWMASHPDLYLRIKLLDPAFDGRWPPVKPRLAATPTAQRAAPRQRLQRQAMLEASPVAALGPTTSEGGVTAAVDLLQALPPALLELASEPWGAMCTALALLIDADEETRMRQVGLLRAIGVDVGAGDPDLADGLVADVLRLGATLVELPTPLRLPLLELLAPALGELSPSQGIALSRGVAQLADADGHRSLFEFAMERVVARRLIGRALPSAHKPAHLGTRPIQQALETVISGLCWVGAEGDGQAAESAMAAAKAALPPLWARSFTLRPAQTLDFAGLDAALVQLAGAAPHVRAALIDAGLAAVHNDAKVTTGERELLRGVAEAVGVALPLATAG